MQRSAHRIASVPAESARGCAGCPASLACGSAPACGRRLQRRARTPARGRRPGTARRVRAGCTLVAPERAPGAPRRRQGRERGRPDGRGAEGPGDARVDAGGRRARAGRPRHLPHRRVRQDERPGPRVHPRGARPNPDPKPPPCPFASGPRPAAPPLRLDIWAAPWLACSRREHGLGLSGCQGVQPPCAAPTEAAHAACTSLCMHLVHAK